MSDRLDVLPIYVDGASPLIAGLVERLERSFGLAPRVRSPWFDAETGFDPSRGQYNSTVLLQLLLRDPTSDPAARVLGVTSVDLFIPVLTYVFGEAQVEGRAAVVSSFRLRSEAYGLPRDERLLAERLEKEAVHELGHTFGLVHCHDPGCVMHAATYVEEIDLRPVTFCERCLLVVRRAGIRAR